MSMKKILMAAAAVTALTAGVANAATITGAKVSGQTLTVAGTGVTATSYVLANSAIIGATGAGLTNATTSGSNEIAVGLSAASSKFYPGVSGTNYSVTYTLSGTANPTFSSNVVASNIKITGQSGTCATAIGASGTATATPVSGGAPGTSSFTAVFNVPSGASNCSTADSPSGLTIDAPFKIANLGTVIGTISYKVVSTDSAYDGAGASHPLVITAAPYTIAVNTGTQADSSTTSKATKLALGGTNGVYTSLLGSSAGGDNIIGTVTFKNASAPTGGSTAPFPDMAAGTLPTLTADVTVNALTSSFNVIKPYYSGVGGGGTLTAFTVAAASPATATKTALAVGARDISVDIASSNSTVVNVAQAYTATITPALSSNTQLTTPAAVTGALETIGLEGTAFLAPWVGGSQSGTTSYVRVSNSGAATGQVTMSLLSPVYSAGTTAGATTCTSTQLPKLATIATGGELVISPDDLTTCFGPFRRGDLSVSLQSASSSLTAKARNVTAATVSELSLGKGTFE